MSSINWQTGERAQIGVMCVCLIFGPHRAWRRCPSLEGESAGREFSGKSNHIAEQEEGSYNINANGPGNNGTRGDYVLNVYQKRKLKSSASLDASRGPARVSNGGRQLPGEEQERELGETIDSASEVPQLQRTRERGELMTERTRSMTWSQLDRAC